MLKVNKGKPRPIKAGDFKRKDKHPLPGKEAPEWKLVPKVKLLGRPPEAWG
jgi:hypothetical protein